MRPEAENLERLISRFLDQEATPNQRRALDQLFADDPAARALFDEISSIDREASAALHSALDGPRLLPRRRVIRFPLSNWAIAITATAACLTAAYLPNVLRPTVRGGDVHEPERAGAWFAGGGDRFIDPPAPLERPHQSVRDAQRDWIVVPGRVPGEYMLIEVNRSRERVRFRESGT